MPWKPLHRDDARISMKLLVEFCDRASCYAALHSNDAAELFKSTGRHFCRALRLRQGVDEVFVGWIGDQCLTPGRLQLAKPFAECLGLDEGQQVEVLAHSAPIARTVMVQPCHGVDFDLF